MGLRRAKPCRHLQNWFVIQTRPRWEKKVAQLLLGKGVETFCPLIKEKRQWSDRVKTIEKPLINAFMFVRINEAQRTSVRLTEGVINFVYKEGKPVMVKDKLVQDIRQFYLSYSNVTVSKASLLSEMTNDCAEPQVEKNKNATLPIHCLDLVLIAPSAPFHFLEEKYR